MFELGARYWLLVFRSSGYWSFEQAVVSTGSCTSAMEVIAGVTPAIPLLQAGASAHDMGWECSAVVAVVIGCEGAERRGPRPVAHVLDAWTLDFGVVIRMDT